jgi:hypothetical protein
MFVLVWILLTIWFSVYSFFSLKINKLNTHVTNCKLVLSHQDGNDINKVPIVSPAPRIIPERATPNPSP